MSALRYSGGIEENADIVYFLYREWYYLQGSQAFLNLTSEQQTQVLTQAELIISKNRNGETAKVRWSI